MSRLRCNGAFNGLAVGSQLGDPQAIARALRHADGPITIIAGEQVARDDARAELAQLRAMLRARVATVPDAKDVAGTPGLGSSSALGVTGVMGHPGVATAIADSAMCLLVGTQLTVTARAGLDDALASVPTYSIGSAAPFVPCTHVHTEDLRGSLKLLTQALNGNGRPTRLRVPDVVPRTELQPPPHDGPGVRYREAMAVLDAALPDGVDIIVDAGNIGASAIHHLPARRDGRFIVALGMGGMGYSFGAGMGVAFGRRRRTRRHRGRRLVLHARHGDSHRGAVPPARDVPAVRQPRACDVCDSRTTVLRRSVQLQPIRSKPVGCRPGGHVPRAGIRRRRHRSTICPQRCRPHSRWTARRSSASSARRTKSRHSQTFSARRP